MTKTAHLVAFLILIAIVAVFGLYLPLGAAMGHDMGCPFSLDGSALCGAPLAHIEHWQSAFATVLVQIFLIAALALYAFFVLDTGRIPHVQRGRCPVLHPLPPSLFQELFSQGILNRRAP